MCLRCTRRRAPTALSSHGQPRDREPTRGAVRVLYVGSTLFTNKCLLESMSIHHIGIILAPRACARAQSQETHRHTPDADRHRTCRNTRTTDNTMHMLYILCGEAEWTRHEARAETNDGLFLAALQQAQAATALRQSRRLRSYSQPLGGYTHERRVPISRPL